MRSPCTSGMICFFLICLAMEFTYARLHQGISNLVKTEFLGGRKTLLQVHDAVKKPVFIPASVERASFGEEVQEEDGEEGYHHNGSKILSQKHEENKAFLDAAERVERMMWKDYRGMDRPRLKPPINNR